MYHIPAASLARPRRSPEPEAMPVSATVSLRLIATSDLHASLLPYDYCANRPDATQGLGAIAQEIAEARGAAQNCLLFDNGDFLQGNPMADYAAYARRRRAHPVITAFNTLGYDAATLGNHEFDYGLTFLSQTLADARFPVVSANIARRLGASPARDETLVPPFALLRRQVFDAEGKAHLLRIGVIGFAPPQLAAWDREDLRGRISTRDILAAARAWLPRLRARGADIIVALAHTGIGAVEPEDGAEHAATALAALPEIDAVIAGHSHMAFPGPGFAPTAEVDPRLGRLSGKPAVMPGHSGSHVGIIDLELGRAMTGPRRWRITGSTSRLASRGSGQADAVQSLQDALAPDHRAALAWSRRQLGQVLVPLHSHFATIAPSAALDLLAAAKAAHVRSALADTSLSGLPVLASAALFRAGGRGGASNFTEIAAGPLRMRNLSDLYPFPNTIVALLQTGAEIVEWLERSAAVFRQVLPGALDQPLRDCTLPSFLFESIPELSYAIDLSQPARYDGQGVLVNPSARRVTGLVYRDRQVAPQDEFILATNNHRAGRARLADPAAGHRVVFTDGARVQTILADHIQTCRTVGAPLHRHWHFLPMPGTTVSFATGRGAASHLGEIANYRPELLRQDDAGFAHYRLHL
jgi:2',3'-cyclic-nucleotide 2'-phosphodiesterase / 3'-nucleotidase